jgi:hypothetical protein
VLVNTSSTSGAAVWIGPQPEWTDYTVEVTLVPNEGSGDAGLLFRAANISPNNDGGQQYYVGLYPTGDKVVLGRMNDGWASLHQASVSVSTDQAYRLKVHAQGSLFEVSVDDEPLLQFTDASYPNGSVGLRTYNRPTTYRRVVVCR